MAESFIKREQIDDIMIRLYGGDTAVIDTQNGTLQVTADPRLPKDAVVVVNGEGLGRTVTCFKLGGPDHG